MVGTLNAAQSPAAIELKGLTKRFGPVVANHNINLSLHGGEILALLGENGSGKTTLMNMLSGIYQPDAGVILLRGQPVHIRSPRDAIGMGIGMVHQHFMLVDVFTARENILMGAGVKGDREGKSLDALCARFGLQIDLDKKIYDMSVGEKQTVEIVKVLARGADILILDEPTAVLTPIEISALFDNLRALREAGHAVVIITHKLDEVMAVSDRVTVLHRGEAVASVVTKETNEYDLTALMVGRPIDLHIHRDQTEPGNVILDVHHLTIEPHEGVKGLREVSFELREGEILGVAGVAGSGQKELCEAIAGLLPIDGGSILLDGRRVDGLTPRDIIRKGISMSFIPEDRLGMGLVGGMSIADNLMVKNYRDQKGVMLRRAGARAWAARMVKELSISSPSIHVAVRKLSGGNVQKVLLGREIGASPRVLITAYPVRGLDINASMTIYQKLSEQKRKGVGVLFIGEDLDVLLALCDRILVLCAGEVTALCETRFATKALLGLKMTRGLKAEDKEDEYA